MTIEQDIELVKAAIGFAEDYCESALVNEARPSFFRILQEIERLRERALPEIPDGWKLVTIRFWRDVMYGADCYTAVIQKEYRDEEANTHYLTIDGDGTSVRESLQAALSKIKEQ